MTYRNIIQTIALGLAVSSAALAEPTQTYAVHKGDGLDAIARRHHTTRAALLRLNPLVTPDNLDVGTSVRVPVERHKEHATARGNPHHHAITVTPIAAANITQAKPRHTISVASQPKANTVQPAAVSTAPPKPKTTNSHANAPRPAVTRPKSAAVAPTTTADPYKYDEPQKGASDLSLGRVIVDLIWKLAVVLGIAYLAIYLLRGIMGRQVGLPGQKGQLKVLESATLGPNRAIHLVRVGNKVLVLGSTPDQITAIGEMDETDTGIPSVPIPRTFSGHLAEAVSGEKGGALPEHFQGGIRHIWDRVQEIRGLHGKGPGA